MIDTAVILCGGEGTRLRPLTYEMPKAMIPICGMPLINWQVQLLVKHGVTKIIFCVGYKGKQIEGFYADLWLEKMHLYNMRLPFKDVFVYDGDTFLGTAGCVKNAINHLPERFYVLNGDNLINIDLTDMADRHEKNNADVTIALTRVEDVRHYGVADLDKERISTFIEKPKPSEAPSNLINAGVYIVNKSVIDAMPEGKVMFEYNIFPKVASIKKLFGYSFSGQWFPTDNFERYEKAIKEWKGLEL